MANLDLTYYHGTDLYSDGDETENRLMEIVQEGKSPDDLELAEVSWPILYHLHPVRENICSWYPFRKGSRILEVGSGCGAVTGALCRSGNEVYSVDLSKRRAAINYERHKQYGNLHIMAGNLNDMVFDEPFDYVVLIGVLEYAGKYTEGDRPYKAFLEKIRKYIKPDGKLLIAIENRIGLKYFAGAKEDHLGKPFAGINGYQPDEGVQTFSRTELQELLNDSGFSFLHFYYPYPDYKFPLEIFSDESIKTSLYGKAYYPVDEPRLALFPETNVARALTREGVAGSFANSFFVEAGFTDPENANEIQYVKLNADRNRRFRIGTMIRKNGGRQEVLKYPLDESAQQHIRNIQQNEKQLGQAACVLQGKETPEGLVYPFVSEPTADMLLDELLKAKDREGVLRLLDDIYRTIAAGPEEKEYDSEKFAEWFGEEKTETKTAACIQPANIDMILDNIFRQNQEYCMMDCEWVTDFPVPLAFVMWRILTSALFHHPQLEQVAAREELFARYHIRKEDEPVYFAWSDHFETAYAGNKSLSRFSKGTRIVEFDYQQTEYQQARIRQLEDTEKELQQKSEAQYQTEAELRQQIFDQKKESDQMKWQVEYGTARIGQLEETEKALREQYTQLEETEKSIRKQCTFLEEKEAELNRKNAELEIKNTQLQSTNEYINSELQGIYQSRSWKMIVKLRKIRSFLPGGRQAEKGRQRGLR